MKSVRFRDPAGVIRQGEWTEDGVVFSDQSYAVDAVDILPPTSPTKIILVGRNHLANFESGEREKPPHPRLIVVPPSAITGHNTTISLPQDSDHVYYGAELGVVIGQQCKHVPQSSAMDVIAGYTCIHDLSNNLKTDIDPFKTFVKSFDNAKPIGPVLIAPEDLPDKPHMETRVNGEKRQTGIATRINFSIPEIIERITGDITLEAGDILSMGSMSGNEPVYRGDELEVEIEGIGVLRNRIAPE